MNQKEQSWDKILRIRTSGRDDSHSDQYHYPYEPTPYAVLERLAMSEHIGKKNTLIDYGCGKGRVDFFLSYQTKCRSVGIEYDERIYHTAMQNKETAAAGGRVTFFNENAETHRIDPSVDRFFFFNPFAVELLKSVIARITESYYENPRDMLLFFYYPSEEYLAYLMTVDELMFFDEIDCSDLFEGAEQREKIMIFKF